jgi:hypothetical protein
MKLFPHWRLSCFALALIVAARGAEAPVSVRLDTATSGAAIPPDYTGFSYEVRTVLPDANGIRYFRADNEPLLTLFRTLGVKSLRIGGNTSDRDAKQLPTEADLDSLFAFAKAADAKVIYCLRLRNGDAAADAATAKYIMDKYGALVDSFSIGQEPSAYPVAAIDTRAAGERMGAANEKYKYADYQQAWAKFAEVIIAAVPNVRFCGPSVHNNGDWARKFLADFGADHHVTLVTEHLYAGGAAQKLASPEAGRDRMLSDDFTRAYQKLHDSFVPQAAAAKLPYRLEEANSYFNGGALGSSNTYSAALWGLDFLCWWAAHDAAGINFHTGDRVSMNNAYQAPRYAAFVSSADGLEIRPLAYGIKAFDLIAHGRITSLKPKSDGVNLTGYAVTDDKGVRYVALINREHGAEAKDAIVKIDGGPKSLAEVISLKQDASDVAATAGITLGRASIDKAGTWAGKWEPAGPAKDGDIEVRVPAATAVIVRFQP